MRSSSCVAVAFVLEQHLSEAAILPLIMPLTIVCALKQKQQQYLEN